MDISTAGQRSDDRRIKWIASIISFLLIILTLFMLCSKARSQIVTQSFEHGLRKGEGVDKGGTIDGQGIRELANTILRAVGARGFYITNQAENALICGKSHQVSLRLAHLRAFARANGWQVDARHKATVALFTPQIANK